MTFRWTDFKVRLPIVGIISRNSKNFETGHPGWMSAEEAVCGAYKGYVSQLPEDKFMQRIEYMRLAGDLGRSPMGTGLMIFLFLLIAAEAMGFSYLLGTWIAADASANTYEFLMYGIVFVLASVLAWVTHAAGSQYYRTNLKRSCFRRYKESGDDAFHSTRKISLAEDQFADGNEPENTRCMNRIIENAHDIGSYGWCWVAGIFVLCIFVGSAYMRIKHMETEMNHQSQAIETQATGNPFAAAANAPLELVASQKEADKKAQAESRASTEGEGIAAILILSVIFAVTQIVGFGAGYKNCFAGKETLKNASGKNSMWFWNDRDGAYADTWGYSTYDAYWEAMQPVKDLVNSRLKKMQSILKQNSTRNLTLSKTFDDYLDEQAERSRVSRDNNNRKRPAATLAAASAPPPGALQPALALSSTDKAKADIEAINEKADQQAYFAKLPPDVREALKPWLKERKEKAAAVSQAELNELF